MKKSLISFVAIFVAWALIDMAVHGKFLMEAYKELYYLWRPEAEFKVALMYLSSALVVAAFIALYSCLVQPKDRCHSVKYGALVGAIVGIGMGLGTYTYMPITCFIATTWFVSELVKFTLGGFILSFFFSE